VLIEPWHLSYPLVFEAEGEIWMLPEGASFGPADALSRDRFPDPLGSGDGDRARSASPVDATPFFP
jgi:hypothetical protein